jgi:formylglycine-generating enzyme required for sulfatase activity
MASILDEFEKLEDRKRFEGHPLLNCGLEEKMFYLRGLGLVMAVDDENHETEQKYITSFIKFLGLPESVFGEILDFINQKEKNLEELVSFLAEKPLLKTAFMIDAVILTEQDGVIREEEKKIVDIFARHFSISDNQMDEIRQKAEEKDYSPYIEGLVLVEGGYFLMGSDEKSSKSDEKPVHKVVLDSFYIGKHPVTQREYKEVIGHNPSEFEGDENRPVESVSWYDAVMYCNRKSEKEGLEPYYEISNIKKIPGKLIKTAGTFTATVSIKGGCGYRLPTEAEWEFAARGGKKTKAFRYSGGDDLDKVGWCDNNSKSQTAPVGLKKPNELLMYDMSGNVNEWCWDRYSKNYYDKSPEKNPTGPPKGPNRVSRGGSYESDRDDCRSACRGYNLADRKHSSIGFRIVRTVE